MSQDETNKNQQIEMTKHQHEPYNDLEINLNNSNINNDNISSKNTSRFCRFFSIESQNVAFIILCCCVLSQNTIVGGANNAILTTIERAYYMTSIESALFLSLYDVANIIASPIIGFFGDRVYKPTLLGISMLGLCMGSLTMTSPQFFSIDSSSEFLSNNSFNNSNNLPLTVEDTLCKITSINNSTSDLTPTIFKPIHNNHNSEDVLINNMKYVFYFANMLNGVSSVALYTIGVSYLESIFIKEKVHMRQGIYYATGAIGVGIGMLVTGNFLNLNSLKLKEKIISDKLKDKVNLIKGPNDVNWIGAWWIIYLIAAGVNLILACLVLRFSPKLMINKSKNIQKNNLTIESQNSIIKANDNKGFIYHVKDFVNNAKLILSNKVYLFIVICTTCETLLIKGFSSYLTKYLEYQYRLPASTATMIAGAIGFVSLIGGALLGSFLVKHFKWHIKQCCKFITCILLVTSLLFLGLIIYCPQEKYINSQNLNFIRTACNCDPNTFYPVCYKEMYLFQTPCIAGCNLIVKSANVKDVYSKCAVLDLLMNEPFESTNATMTSCSRPAPQCMTNLVLVCLIGLAVLFLSSIIILPLLRVILESVSEDNQSFALGIRSLVTKLFGNIPGPIIFASIVDQSCIQWTQNTVSNSKTCRLYNNKAFSLGLGLLGSGFRLMSGIFALVTLVFISKQDSANISNFSNEIANENDREINEKVNEERGELNKGFTD